MLIQVILLRHIIEYALSEAALQVLLSATALCISLTIGTITGQILLMCAEMATLRFSTCGYHVYETLIRWWLLGHEYALLEPRHRSQYKRK